MKNPRWKLCTALLLTVTLIFCCLYGQCIFGDKMYAYSDIGADTIDQYLPVMVYELEHIGSSGYDLQYGLGDYTASQLYKYLTPFDLPILLLGEENLAAGILIGTWLKYCLIALAALFFFLRLFREEKTAFVCALLWTYSGYAVLWGQHYRFLTVILAFTVAMCGMQLFLEGDKKRFLLIPALAVLAGTSYYFLYTSCFFFAAYGVLYLYFTGKKPGEIGKKAIWFALAMIPAACIGGVYLVPAVAEFFDSARVAEVTAGAGESGVLYSPSYILCLMGRFLSSDILGSGSAYRGPTNYYEMAILRVSLLSVFSLCLLLTSRHWKRAALITFGCTLLVCMPGFSRIIVFSATNQRWTYLLCFAQVIAIGFGIRELLDGGISSMKRRVLAVCMANLCIFGVIAAMWFLFHRFGVLLDVGACAGIAVFALIYSGIFLLAGRLKHPKTVLLLLAAAELVLCGWQTVNDRQLVSRAEWESGMYYDGTEQLAQTLSQRDDSFYRLNKTYDSVRQNDALIQGYNGLGVYLSTNSRELVHLYQSYGYPLMLGNRVNWIRFAGDDLLSNVMLGAKYVVSDGVMDPEFYEEVEKSGNLTAYQNRFYPGFGYLYTETVSESAVLGGTRLEKLLLLCDGYYLTGQAADETAEVSVGMNLLPSLREEEGRITVDWPRLSEGQLVSGLRVTLDAPAPSDIRLYRADGTLLDQVYFGTGRAQCALDMTELASGCYLEGVALSQIQSARLVCVEKSELLEALSDLGKRGVAEVEQSGDSFTARVENPSSDSAMLCIPLIFSDRWQASVDGEDTRVYNINGGLVGVQVPAGDHTVTMTYRDPGFRLGAAISIAATVLYLAGAVFWLRRGRKGPGAGNTRVL